ncbi:flavin reductase family protein [Marinomonas sp. THO17]|uniref:flavin reductase family protein n=1 Tax=Marinomonas sp. THO17 TaxID=3149048 RepID=UPI00336BEE6E
MHYPFDQLSGRERYHLITQTVIPRPIAWIMSKNDNGTFNLAPFSYFTSLSSDPALLIVSIGNKNPEKMKDTKRNLLREKECVLHIADGDLVKAVNDSAATLAYGESEVNQSGLQLTEFVDQLPRIKQAKVAYHCRLFDVHRFADTAFEAMYLEILNLYLDDDLIHTQGERTYIDSKKLNPLARLGGNDYALLGDTITIKRPD